MTKATNQFSKGFTLVESLVAISILSLSITATFTAVQLGLKSTLSAKDQITAFYLAQEAMEFIKNTRDENALHSIRDGSTNWLTGLTITSGGLSGPCDYGKVCIIDSPQDSVSFCSGALGSCPKLNQDSTTGLFSYASGPTWNQSPFRREIQFRTVAGNPNEVLVTISMSWTTEGVANSFQVSQSLFNRQ